MCNIKRSICLVFLKSFCKAASILWVSLCKVLHLRQQGDEEEGGRYIDEGEGGRYIDGRGKAIVERVRYWIEDNSREGKKAGEAAGEKDDREGEVGYIERSRILLALNIRFSSG